MASGCILAEKIFQQESGILGIIHDVVHVKYSAVVLLKLIKI